ncbi:unc-119-like protein B-like protein [Chytriomyces cf. hyalinus JEL632]|nr:unc-119-like protein B-like protein [Chytriomyces cf. hyalinus JEL632]
MGQERKSVIVWKKICQMATSSTSRFGLSSASIPSEKKTSISSSDVLRLKKPAKGFLCKNKLTNPVQFVEFKIRDMKSNNVFFEVGRPVESLEWHQTKGYDHEDVSRTITYEFPKEILSYESVGTSLVFAVEPNRALNSFRMIEMHYFKDKLIKSFDFSFGFCIPGSVNTWENVYKLPKLDAKSIKEMVDSPLKTVSDSYYFVDDKLVMHNKAYYSYY